jgi:hypothetical protein
VAQAQSLLVVRNSICLTIRTQTRSQDEDDHQHFYVRDVHKEARTQDDEDDNDIIYSGWAHIACIVLTLSSAL